MRIAALPGVHADDVGICPAVFIHRTARQLPVLAAFQQDAGTVRQPPKAEALGLVTVR